MNRIKFNTLASFVAAVANSVQFSECLQFAITGRGSSPLDELVPRGCRRLAAILQLPVLAVLAAGETAKVREAFDGD